MNGTSTDSYRCPYKMPDIQQKTQTHSIRRQRSKATCSTNGPHHSSEVKLRSKPSLSQYWGNITITSRPINYSLTQIHLKTSRLVDRASLLSLISIHFHCAYIMRGWRHHTGRITSYFNIKQLFWSYPRDDLSLWAEDGPLANRRILEGNGRSSLTKVLNQQNQAR